MTVVQLGPDLVWMPPMTLSLGIHVSRDDERNGPKKKKSQREALCRTEKPVKTFADVAGSRSHGCKDFS